MSQNYFIELADINDKTHLVNLSQILHLEYYKHSTNKVKVILSTGKIIKCYMSIPDFEKNVIDTIAFYEQKILEAKAKL